MVSTHPFAGRRAVLATQHGKQAQIAPALQALGIELVVPDAFDTDRFGSFTREVRRVGNQLEAARRKAEAAMQQTGLDLGLASEGSFGPHPATPLLTSDLELVLLVDRRHGWEIRGMHRTSEANAQGQYVENVAEARALAERWGFPEQGVVVRRTAEGKRWIYKELTTYAALEERVAKMLKWPLTRRVFLETDLRAHRNPLRRQAIRTAAEDLARRLASECPACGGPGFGPEASVPGLPCANCGIPTRLAKAERWRCPCCGHEAEHPLADGATVADAAHCGFCNP